MQRVLYKLTTKDFKTQKGQPNETLWGENITHTAPGNGELCSSAYLHAYTTPLLAIYLNPIHANIKDFVLWRSVGKVEKSDGTKVGCTQLKTIKIVKAVDVTTVQRVAFAILCSLLVYKDPTYTKWAKNWFNDTDRSYAAAYAAAYAADAAADAAAYAADAAAAAYAAAYAADAAAYAAYAAYAADAAYAAYAADAAYAASNKRANLATCARKSLAYK